MNLSVIIPSYNRAHSLGRALDSVLAQSLPVDEVLLIDDGSQDHTPQLIAQDYPQVRYIRQDNLGVSAARNLGIRESQGQWIAFLDSDDEWHVDKIRLQFAALTRSAEYKICHCHETWFRNGKHLNQLEKHKKRGGHIFPYCLDLCVISPSAVVIHRSVLEEIGDFDETLVACEDYDLWLRICARLPVLYVEEPLVIKHGGHGDQLSKQFWGMDRFRIYALDKILQEPELKSDYRRLALEVICEKVRIYLNGAKKRQRRREVLEYQALLSDYEQAYDQLSCCPGQ